jgi:hypothetical protein
VFSLWLSVTKKSTNFRLMKIKLVFLSIIVQILIPVLLYSQTRSAFSGDPEKFRTELVSYMGPNLNAGQLSNLSTFSARWDSLAFSKVNMARIIDIASRLSSRNMRPVPHFNDFIMALNYFIDYKREDSYFKNWLNGLGEIVFNIGYTNDQIDRFLKITSSILKDNILDEEGIVRWKVKNNTPVFKYDTLFYADISNATLTCYSQKDSTEIYNASGKFYPEIQLFKGTSGKITWEKAGYTGNEAFAEIRDYSLNTAKSSFTVDSAILTNKAYFKEPVIGTLTDKAISFRNKDIADYPRFVTYTKKFVIKNMYEGVNYEGGLTFEGATVKGTGENYNPATISLYRNDTLYLKIRSTEFVFSKTGLNSPETAITLYLGQDSIYHSNLGFSYFAGTRQVNLFRTNNPISKSPYFDSFHRLDMYFEYLSWNMNESKIILSRARGASLGQAQFESTSYFNAGYFMRLMGLDNYHPLYRLIKFAEWYYSETFPVPEFAKWLDKPQESVTGLCIDLANKGFIYYDRTNNEVTIKQKTKDFIDAYAKKKDYDILNILSETKSPTDNASLDMKNFELTINGVRGVFLSDSQKVAIYPYKQQLVIGKNRSILFDGVVDAGLFTIFGHKFSFSYDTFKIDLQKIDSIKISVETDKKDNLGNSLIKDVDNLIQLGSAQLYIDNPDNKSGLKSLKQYPIIDATTYSYIFYDKIPGLSGIYKQKDFYFKVDPFTYNNIDHYTNSDMNLSGEFFGGNILKPMRQYLTIQENNSLGFNMTIPEEGIDVYNGKGRIFDNLNMSNKGLIGSGMLQHLTATAKSEEFKFFPDSMITHATTFIMKKDTLGILPVLNSQDVDVKWLTQKNEWLATNSEGKDFNMFENSTTLDGSIKLTPSELDGAGIINMTDSRVTSNQFRFTPNAINADTADYNLKSTTTNGYSFIAENANTNINFDQRESHFHLNTDSSMVKFPELQYICTMTDFAYNMDKRVLSMEQKGKSNISLLTPAELLRVDLKKLDKPTFFATNSLTDTVAFSALKGSYHLDQEFIEAEDINYIHVADALIQPENGKIIINRRASIKQMQSAIIAVNNRHILHDGKIDIESTKRYTGSAVYDYISENKDIQYISFPEISVDTMTTSARGYIPITQKFMLSPEFSFAGDVMLYAKNDLLTFTGAAGIVHNCSVIKSYNIKFKAKIDPKNVMIPVSEKPRDMNDNQVFSGSYIATDSVHIYPAFLSPERSWTDVPLVSSSGYLYFEKAKGRYVISSLEKLADQTLPGNMIAFDKNFCILSGEGNINLGAHFDLMKFNSAGKVIHSIDSGKVNIQAILAIDFYFSSEALKVMSDEIRMMPSLKPVNLNSDLNKKGMTDLIGSAAATQIKEEMDLFGTSKSLPKEFTYKLLLNDVNLYWNQPTESFRSTGKIGIGFIGNQPINVYVDGYIEIQHRRSGDLVDIYLKADKSTWYYFSYFRGVLMTQSSNSNYNTIITSTKLNARKHPESTTMKPYTYMIAVEGRLARFLRRMAGDTSDEEPVTK